MGLIREAWGRAVDQRQQSKMDRQLAEMKEQGHDICQLCGEEIPVYEADDHEDVLRRLTEHANEAEDHVHHSQKGWMHVDDLKSVRTGIAGVGHRVALKAGLLTGLYAGLLLAAHLIAGVSTVFLAVAGLALIPLVMVTLAGAFVSWYFSGVEYELRPTGGG